MPERTATPLLDERGPKTQLILLNRKSSLRSVSVRPELSPSCRETFLSPPRLAGENTPGPVVAETEACDYRVILKAEDRRTRPHDDGKHELSFRAILASPLQLSFVKLLSVPSYT